jgi:hypothetical protein
MPSIFRINQPGSESITDVGSVEAVEGAVQVGGPGRYDVDEIRAEQFPSGHTSRQWGRLIRHPEGRVDDEPHPWAGTPRYFSGNASLRTIASRIPP